jgi:hypothetical protein
MKNKNKIITTTVILTALLIVGAYFAFNSQLFSNLTSKSDSTKRETPMRVTMEFYNQWLEERKSTSTTPYDSGLLQSTVLTDEVRSQIERAHANRIRGDVDPVLCLTKIPNRIDGEEISSTDNKAIVVVKPRDKSITTEHQAVVSLTLVGDQWLITKLDCMVGEMMAEKKFDFEKTGQLLKESIEAPYNNQQWHLVYEQETVPGFVVPLTFDAESICVGTDKSANVCDPTTFTEASTVFIQAGMTENGAVVKQMTIR